MDSLSFFVILTCVLALCISRRARHQLPPGPRRLPFFGNSFDRPTLHAHLVYFVTDAIHKAIVAKEVETRMKGKTKMFRTSEDPQV